MNYSSDSKEWRDQKMIASSYFMFALMLLVGTALIFLVAFQIISNAGFFIMAISLVFFGDGALLFINPYRRLKLKLSSDKGIFSSRPRYDINRINRTKEMINEGRFFDSKKSDVLESNPRRNFFLGTLDMLFGIALVMIAIFFF